MSAKKSVSTEKKHTEQSFILHKLYHANIERTIHLLENYHKYQQIQDQNIDAKTSKIVLNIISECMGSNPIFTDGDKNILENAGGLLALGIHAAIEELKDLPWHLGQQVYPVLWEQYFHNDGPAISISQLIKRLAISDIVLDADETLSTLKNGHSMMAAAIFDNKLLATWKSSLLSY